MQTLIDKFDLVFQNYIAVPNNPNYDPFNIPLPANVYLNNQVVPIQGPPVPNKYNDSLTSGITNYFLKNYDTIYEIIQLYVNIYEHALQTYANWANLAPRNYNIRFNVDDPNILFSLKGGLSQLLVVSKSVYEMPNDIANQFMTNFVNNVFKKSDIDFGILINFDEIPEEHHVNVYNDVHKISLIVLIIVRDYIIKYKYKFSDFEKGNEIYQKYILKNIRDELNTNLLPRGALGNNICKIGTNDIYEDEPCPNDVLLNNDVGYDEFVAHNPIVPGVQPAVTVFKPRRFGILNLSPQKKYVISSNIISYRNAAGLLVKFGLTRMKVNFGLYGKRLNPILNNLECCKYRKGKGEIIDVSITHPEDEGNHNLVVNYQRYLINNAFNLNMPTLFNLYDDIFRMFRFGVNFPWSLPKYTKRINRFFAFANLRLNINITVPIINNLLNFFNSCITYLNRHNNHQNMANNIIFANQFAPPGIAPNSIESEIVIMINKIHTIANQNDYQNNRNDLDQYIRDMIRNIQNSINLFISIRNYFNNPTIFNNDPNLENRTNILGGSGRITGGFNPCNLNQGLILKEVIDRLTSFLPFGRPNILNITLNDKFFSCYKYLIRVFLDHTPTQQVFINNNGVNIYNSNNDPDLLNNPALPPGPGNPRKVLYNYNSNITAFIFLNFLVNYQAFLNTYNNMDFDTESRNPKLLYNHINWQPPALRRNEVYKDKLLNKNPEEIVKDFCSIFQTKYYRLINLLILNLKNSLNTFINNPNPARNLTKDQIIAELFEINHRSISPYDDNSIYNYMYTTWKKRLARLVFNRIQPIVQPLPAGINLGNINDYIITLINNQILLTIRNITGQRQVIPGQINEEYLADSEALFSYLYKVDFPVVNNNKNSYFGSCIPSTILEIYLLTKIHEDFKDISFGCEFPVGRTMNDRHNFWTLSQLPQAANHNLSHWTCIWNRLTYNPGAAQIINNQSHNFRNIYVNPNNISFNILDKVQPLAPDNDPANINSITTSLKGFLNHFIYTPLDLSITFMRVNPGRIVDPIQKRNYLQNTIFRKLRNYIFFTPVRF
jgi:hypothetical protein